MHPRSHGSRLTFPVFSSPEGLFSYPVASFQIFISEVLIVFVLIVGGLAFWQRRHSQSISPMQPEDIQMFSQKMSRGYVLLPQTVELSFQEATGQPEGQADFQTMKELE